MNHNSCVYFAIVRRFQSVIHNGVDISGTPGASPATGKTWGIWESLMSEVIKLMLHKLNASLLDTDETEQMTSTFLSKQTP
jgi:hypothetical protein